MTRRLKMMTANVLVVRPDNLNPCRICGGEPTIEIDVAHPDDFRVSCLPNNCRTVMARDWETMVAMWNEPDFRSAK
jgi:hypothetical protein